jgi:hypothetical protein
MGWEKSCFCHRHHLWFKMSLPCPNFFKFYTFFLTQMSVDFCSAPTSLLFPESIFTEEWPVLWKLRKRERSGRWQWFLINWLNFSQAPEPSPRPSVQILIKSSFNKDSHPLYLIRFHTFYYPPGKNPVRSKQPESFLLLMLPLSNFLPTLPTLLAAYL